ncbi:MAG: hypothetical protein ACM34M_14420 [Ignavibacteria bacterium]
MPKITKYRIEGIQHPGKKLSILADKIEPAGVYEVQFNGRYLSNNIYL